MNKPEQIAADLAQFLPDELGSVVVTQQLIPSIAKDATLLRKIELAVSQVPTRHALHCADARVMPFLSPGSVHLIITSPPYWTLKDYDDVEGQLGHLDHYESFLDELDKVWRGCFEALVPGGRLVCVEIGVRT